MPTNFTKRVQALNLQRWGVGAVLLGLWFKIAHPEKLDEGDD